MMAAPRSWRGRAVAPATPAEAWRAFGRETAVILAVIAGVAVVALLIAGRGIGPVFRTEWAFFWLVVGAAVLVPLALGYEVWLLRRRLAAFAAGGVFVDADEVSPAVATQAGRKRRETPAQRRRRRAFLREAAVFGTVWLFCTGMVGWMTWHDWQAGRPGLGQSVSLFVALLAALPVWLVLSLWLKSRADRGLD
jgi:hypothetical protein